MPNKSLFRPVFIGLTLLGATPAFSQQISDAARIAQMEATIRELNLQMATLIKENERLSNEMKSALSSQRDGKRVVRGCDLLDAQRVLLSKTKITGLRLLWVIGYQKTVARVAKNN